MTKGTRDMLFTLLVVLIIAVVFFAIPMYSVSQCARTPGCFQ